MVLIERNGDNMKNKKQHKPLIITPITKEEMENFKSDTIFVLYRTDNKGGIQVDILSELLNKEKINHIVKMANFINYLEVIKDSKKVTIDRPIYKIFIDHDKTVLEYEILNDNFKNIWIDNILNNEYNLTTDNKILTKNKQKINNK